MLTSSIFWVLSQGTASSLFSGEWVDLQSFCMIQKSVIYIKYVWLIVIIVFDPAKFVRWLVWEN